MNDCIYPQIQPYLSKTLPTYDSIFSKYDYMCLLELYLPKQWLYFPKNTTVFAIALD